MIEDKELQALVQFSSEKKVLSLYLDTDLAHRSKDAIKLLFRERIKSLEEPPPKSDIQAIEKYLDFEYDWQARGLAIFASGQELWEAFPLPIPVRTQAFFTEKPYVRVLSDVLDRFGKYGVALIDRESVRLFSVAWGRIQSETESFGEELKRHKQGGWASARYQRHEDNLALHNLKQAVEITQAFCEQTDCQRLMLGGSKEMLAQVVELMPSHMRAKVIGEFAADMEASPNEILSHTLDVAYQVDLEEEKRIVSEVVTAAAKGGAGVIGLADTLYVLQQGRVHQLLVQEDYSAGGYTCTNCGYVAEEPAGKCPFCGHDEMTEVPDAVNRAIHKAIQTGAEVNIVRQNEELEKAGNIGAVLRY